MIRHGFVLQNPHETDVVAARSFNVTDGIDSVHVREHEKFKHGAWIDLSPLAEVCGVQVVVVQFVADFDQFAHGIFFVDSDSQIQRNYYLISVSHCGILYLLSGRVLVQLYYTTKAATGLPFTDNPVVFCLLGC